MQQIAIKPLSSPVTISRPTIIVGLGNPILGDDGIGWKVAEAVKRQLSDASTVPAGPVTVECYSLGGLSLMEQLIGYDRAIIVDAFTTDQPAGSIFSLSLEDLPDHTSLHTTSAHDTSLKTAIKMGKEMGAHLPCDVTIIGVASKQLYEFSEELTADVAAAVPDAVQLVIDLIHKGDSK